MVRARPVSACLSSRAFGSLHYRDMGRRVEDLTSALLAAWQLLLVLIFEERCEGFAEASTGIGFEGWSFEQPLALYA